VETTPTQRKKNHRSQLTKFHYIRNVYKHRGLSYNVMNPYRRRWWWGSVPVPAMGLAPPFYMNLDYKITVKRYIWKINIFSPLYEIPSLSLFLKGEIPSLSYMIFSLILIDLHSAGTLARFCGSASSSASCHEENLLRPSQLPRGVFFQNSHRSTIYLKIQRLTMRWICPEH
jgi:hypothetical protein